MQKQVECRVCRIYSNLGQWKVRAEKPSWICPFCRVAGEKPVSRGNPLWTWDDDDGMEPSMWSPDEFDLETVTAWDGGGDDSSCSDAGADDCGDDFSGGGGESGGAGSDGEW